MGKIRWILLFTTQTTIHYENQLQRMRTLETDNQHIRCFKYSLKLIKDIFLFLAAKKII